MAPLPASAGQRLRGHEALILWGGELLCNGSDAPLSARVTSARAPVAGPKDALCLPPLPLSARRATSLSGKAEVCAEAYLGFEACAALLRQQVATKSRPQPCAPEGGRLQAPTSGPSLVPKPPGQPPVRQPRSARGLGSQQHSRRSSTASTRAGTSAGTDDRGPAPAPAMFLDVDVVDAMRGRGVLVRGELNEHIAAREALDQAMAQRRRSASKEASEANRAENVQRRRSRALQRQRLQEEQIVRNRLQESANEETEPAEPIRRTKEVEVVIESFQHKVFRMLAEEASDPHRGSSPLQDIATPEGTDSRASSPAMGHVGSMRSNTSRRSSVLGCIARKSSLTQRMSNLDSFCKHGRKKSRMQKLLEKKRDEFEKRPETERKQLSEAFKKHDGDKSGSLDQKEMIACLTDLGLKPNSQVEQREIRRITQEVAILGTVDFLQFVFEMIPRARSQLQELRRGHLLREFEALDKDASGYLDNDECRQVLETMCTANLDPQGLVEMEAVFVRTIDELSNGDDHLIDFDAFEELVGRSREQHQRILQTRISEICIARDLSPDDVSRHSGELVLLHHSFQQRDLHGASSLGWDSVRSFLIEYSLLPRDYVAESAIFEDVSTVGFSNGKGMTFSGVLALVRSLRQGQLAVEEHSLRQMFARLDRDRSASLEISEVAPLLEELNVQPHCWQDQLWIRRLLDDVDADRSGTLDFSEFSVLVQRVREGLASAVRRRQRVTANTLGFTESQVAELRDVFFRLDAEQDGILRIDQLRKALDMLKRPMSPSDLRTLVDKIDVASTGQVDFQSFMRFFKEVAPPAE